MSSVLPQVAQTKRVNSLPSDLRGLAEELIAKKFPDKVRKEEKKTFIDVERLRYYVRRNMVASQDREYDYQRMQSAMYPGGMYEVPTMYVVSVRAECRVVSLDSGRREIVHAEMRIPMDRGINNIQSRCEDYLVASLASEINRLPGAWIID